MHMIHMTNVKNIILIEVVFFFFQAEDGIRDLVRSRGLGDVYKRQEPSATLAGYRTDARMHGGITFGMNAVIVQGVEHLSLIHI